MLVNRYPTKNGKELVLINTHLSAFDDGSLKKQEMQFVKDYVLEEYSKGNYVIVGGDWNQSPPTFKLNTFGEDYKVDFFKLTNIADDFVPKSWTWVYDPISPTNRYVNKPYSPEKTYKTIIDIFLVSPNVQIVQSHTFDLHFKNSDHNPISIGFRLKN
jgi:endonuclease/exonuclease/phosphatase family metal-dependent hydrolase